MIKNHNYIKSLLKPNGSKPAGRRVWSIDLESVWLPFFTATSTTGDTIIPHEALGAPLRLAYNADGTVKFGKTGRPVVKVAKPISDSVKLVRENLIAQMMAFAHEVLKDREDDYKAQVKANHEAGLAITQRDRNAVELALLQLATMEQEPLPEPEPEPEPVTVS